MLALFSNKPNPTNKGNYPKWIDTLIEKLPISLVDKFSYIAPLIPYYHMVSNERIIHICHLYSYKNEKQFTNDIEFLCSRYQPISLVDLIDHVRHGKKLKKGSYLLTFDDGYSQMYSVVAPILTTKGIPAVFFLNTDFIDNKALCYKNKASIIIDSIISNENIFHNIREPPPIFQNVPFREVPKRILSIGYKKKKVLDDIAELFGIYFNDYLIKNQPYLSSFQIRRMIEMGFYFGAHSKDHPLYADLSLEDQLNQTIGSLQFIKEEFKLPYSVFAFPHKDYSVTNEFFHTIENYADLTFGTGGIKIDSVATNLQRIDFEITLEPAKSILTRQFIKKRIYLWLQKARIKRGLEQRKKSDE